MDREYVGRNRVKVRAGLDKMYKLFQIQNVLKFSLRHLKWTSGLVKV